MMMGMGNTSNSSHFGFSPTKFLNDKLRARDWDAARIRVLSHPWDACFRAKQKNNATPLHLACLYRAPYDLVEWILDVNPQALLCQDSEGWTPLHVILLYGNDDKTALLLIRRGGPEAVSIQSRIVGAPLHLACRHGCSTAVIRELLRANPAMATTANEYATKPSSILWQQYARNPENKQFLNDLSTTATTARVEGQNERTLEEERIGGSARDLVDRVALLLRAAKGKQHMHPDDRQEYSVILHDVVVSTDDTVGDLSHMVALMVRMHPDKVRSTDEMGNLPLHKAASTIRSSSRSAAQLLNPALVALMSSTAKGGGQGPMVDAVEVLLQSYPMAARIPNRQGLLPLQIALSKGKRTWRTGLAAMVLAAPDVLLNRDVEAELLPFQLAAAMEDRSDNDGDRDDEDSDSGGDQDAIETVETIMELLLACPHAMTTRNQ